MSRSFKFVLIGLALLVAGAGLTLLHLENRRLQRQLAARASQAHEGTRLREDNARLDQLLAEQPRSGEASRALVRRQIEEAQAEIARREQTADQQHAERVGVAARDAVAVETNRDPRLGLARLEYFKNRGRATPSAAFETLVWAAIAGDEAALADATTLNSATRARAEAFLAELPPEERAKWTPEKLGQLWFSGLFTELSAIQIVGETTVAPGEALVRLRLANRDGEEKLAVRQTPDGWKVLAPSAAVDHLKKKLTPGK